MSSVIYRNKICNTIFHRTLLAPKMKGLARYIHRTHDLILKVEWILYLMTRHFCIIATHAKLRYTKLQQLFCVEAWHASLTNYIIKAWKQQDGL